MASKAVFCRNPTDFILIICVFFMPPVLGYAEHCKFALGKRCRSKFGEARASNKFWAPQQGRRGDADSVTFLQDAFLTISYFLWRSTQVVEEAWLENKPTSSHFISRTPYSTWLLRNWSAGNASACSTVFYQNSDNWIFGGVLKWSKRRDSKFCSHFGTSHLKSLDL